MADSPSKIDASILHIAARAMPALASPRPSDDISALIPELLRTTDAAKPPGPMQECLHAGLWLLADDLDKAHKICQEVPTSHGSAWHAIVHRREGDFWNSKYWWHRAAGIKWRGLADHLPESLATVPGQATAAVMRSLSGPAYDPSIIVDLVEANAARPTPEMTAALVIVQRVEWLALFEECWTA